MEPATTDRTADEGLRVFHAELPGPTTAGLVFRVGMVDEPLPRRGISHLVEHLALSSLGSPSFEVNGSVGPSETTLWCSGTPGQVGDFLRRTATALRDLPADRVETERSILRTEQAGRSRSLAEAALALTYGPDWYGLCGHEELGLDHLGPAEVQTWAKSAFGRRNAVLWIAGELPDDLEVSLPEGEPKPLPVEPRPRLPLPGWRRVEPPGITVSMIVPRSPAAIAAARHLDRRLRERIRHELGLSYHAGAALNELDVDHTQLVVHCDALPDQAARVCHETEEILQRFADEGPTPEEHERDCEAVAAALSDPTALPSHLQLAARLGLHGRARPTISDRLDELATVTPESVRDVLDDAAGRALYLLGGVEEVPAVLDWPQAELPQEPVRGRRFRPRVRSDVPGRRPPPGHLRANAEGITFKLSKETTTVRFDDVHALRRFADGSQTLHAGDGTALLIDPRAWEGGHRLQSLIDSRVPAEVAFDSPEAPRASVRYRNQMPSPVLWLGLAVAALAFYISYATLTHDDPGTATDTASIVTFFLIGTALTAATIPVLLRRRGQPR